MLATINVFVKTRVNASHEVKFYSPVLYQLRAPSIKCAWASSITKLSSHRCSVFIPLTICSQFLGLEVLISPLKSTTFFVTSGIDWYLVLVWLVAAFLLLLLVFGLFSNARSHMYNDTCSLLRPSFNMFYISCSILSLWYVRVWDSVCCFLCLQKTNFSTSPHYSQTWE